MPLYSEEQQAFRRTFKKYVDKEILPRFEEWERHREVPRDFWREFGEYGYLCPWLPEEYGGAGAGFEYSMIILEELARAGAGGVAVGVGVHSEIAAPYLASFGSAEQKARWLPGCATGDMVMAIAMTEPGAGSDLQAIVTTAVKEGNKYVINGQKTFISNGICADLVLVACKTDPRVDPPHKGISLIAVEAGAPGLIKGRKLEKLGLHCQDTAEIYFEDCRVPVGNLIGQEGQGFACMMQKLQQERLITAALSQNLAERMLSDALEYAGTRQAFGKPIGKFQHNAFKIAGMATEVELGRTYLDRLVAEHIEGRDIITGVSMAKWWIGEMANRVAYDCLQLFGGYGYMEEYPIARHYRDVRAHTIFAGSTEVMKLIIARRLGL
ncbi:MAG: acyl-CoA dehydrogenase family protein [Bacillota bacterium]